MERARAEALWRPTQAATASPFALRPGVEQAPESLPPIAEFGLRDFSRIDSGVNLPAPPKPYQFALSSDLGRRMPRQKPSLQLPDLHRPLVRGLHDNPQLRLSVLKNLGAAAFALNPPPWSDRRDQPNLSPTPVSPRLSEFPPWLRKFFAGTAKFLEHLTVDKDMPIDPNGVLQPAPSLKTSAVMWETLRPDFQEPKFPIPLLQYKFDPRTNRPPQPASNEQTGERDGTP